VNRLPAAVAPPVERDDVRLVVLGPRELHVHPVRALPGLLRAGDLVVVNDAATWPASLHGVTARGEPVEVRLTSGAIASGDRTTAVLFGAGDWRTRTEDRPPPPQVHAGEALEVGVRLAVTKVLGPRLVEIEVPPLGAMFTAGRPVQYAHLARPLAAWDVATVYAGRPWAVEMPSAGRPLTWAMLAALAAEDVRVASLTHAAGLSSTVPATARTGAPNHHIARG
jgi:S-adenosylmethionine:tRNA ribosyltransferase-isomerase